MASKSSTRNPRKDTMSKETDALMASLPAMVSEKPEPSIPASREEALKNHPSFNLNFDNAIAMRGQKVDVPVIDEETGKERGALTVSTR